MQLHYFGHSFDFFVKQSSSPKFHYNMRSPVVKDTTTKLGLPDSDKFVCTHLVNNTGYTFPFMQVEELDPTLLKNNFEKN